MGKISRDEAGAASVLVVFIMLMLVTFGALAITSANANYKLSKRALEWHTMYYELDAKGEEFLAALDEKLAEAERTAVNEVLGESADDLGGTDWSDDTLIALYLYYAENFLQELTDYPELRIEPSDEDEVEDSLLVGVNIRSVTDETCGLHISIKVLPVAYQTTEPGDTLVRANDSLRYEIESWNEFQGVPMEEPAQEPSNLDEADEPAGFWDGSIE